MMQQITAKANELLRMPMDAFLIAGISRAFLKSNAWLRLSTRGPKPKSPVSAYISTMTGELPTQVESTSRP